MYITPSEYGKLAIFLMFVSVYQVFIGMGLWNNISKNFFKVSKYEMSLFIGNILIVLGVSTVIYFALSVILYTQIENLFSIPVWFLLVLPLIASMNMVNIINTTILRQEQRAYMFGIFEVSNSLLKIGITVFLIIVFGLSWYSQVIAAIVTGVIFLFVGLMYMFNRGYITFKYDKVKVKSIFKISAPLAPHLLGALVINVSDRLFIESLIGLEAVGLYAVGYLFGMIVAVFADAFIKAWSPWFYQNIENNSPNKKEKIVQYSYCYIFAILAFAVMFSYVCEFLLPYIVDEKYIEAKEFIFFIALSYAIDGIFKILQPYLVHITRTYFLSVTTTLAAMLNLILNYYFINSFGIIGAAYATLCAFSLSTILVFFYTQKHFPMPWLYMFNKYNKEKT